MEKLILTCFDLIVLFALFEKRRIGVGLDPNKWYQSEVKDDDAKYGEYKI